MALCNNISIVTKISYIAVTFLISISIRGKGKNKKNIASKTKEDNQIDSKDILDFLGDCRL